MKHRRLVSLVVSGAVVASAVAIGLTTHPQPTAASQAASAPVPAVPVAEVVVRKFAATARFTGHLEASHVVEVTPRIPGLLLEARVPEGRGVAEGDVLFRLDPAPYRLKVVQARAHLERALALSAQARTEHTRLTALSDSGTASLKAMDDAIAEKASREADVAAARAALAEAELLLSYTEIRSPIAGVADRVMIDPGNQVVAGPSNVLTRVVSTEELFVTFHIDEATVARLGARSLQDLAVEVEVASEGGTPRRGRLDFSAAEFDRATGTLRARAIVSNPDGQLRPGMFVRVRLPVEAATEAVLVTDSAIHTAPGGRYVLVVGADGTVRQKPVSLGMTEGDLRVVTDGLAAGDRVVLKGLVFPGMAVDPQPVAMPGATPAPGRDAS